MTTRAKLLLKKNLAEKNEKGQVGYEAGPEDDMKNGLAGLVVKKPLSGQPAERTACHRQKVQDQFRYPPFGSFRLDFVKGVKDKRDNVYPGQVSDVDGAFQNN